jgi:ferritin-like metal-binding protein YciE
MAKAAHDAKLRDGFKAHLEETKGQVARIEQAFELLGTPARAKKCHGMEGLVEEGSAMMEEDGAAAVIDAGLVSAAQKVEHYEIAAYGTMVRYAQKLGLTQVARLLQQNLDEEKATDEKLTTLAESGINDAAMTATAESNGRTKTKKTAKKKTTKKSTKKTAKKRS